MQVLAKTFFYTDESRTVLTILHFQAYSDLQPFTDLYRHPPGTAIDLTSAPVILHLLRDLSLLEDVTAAGDSMENCDFKKV